MTDASNLEAHQSIVAAWSHLEQAYELVKAVNGSEDLRLEIKEAWKCVRAARESLEGPRKRCDCDHDDTSLGTCADKFLGDWAGLHCRECCKNPEKFRLLQ